jgi:UDP-N-acetylmuramyl pentapeptide phosphotransferase/UDP-N-acetylglucosamine-1-phosphate transferase
MSPWLITHFLLPALVAWALIAGLRRTPLAGRLADSPNERSLHSTPTPRLGGIAVVATVLAAVAVNGGPGLIFACAAVLAILSLADDLRSLPVEVRLPGHAVTALVAVLAGASPGSGQEGLGPWMAVLAVVGLVWMANLFNFMDGADGLAGLMSLIGFGTLALAAAGAGEPGLAAPCAAIAGAAAGFLVHNLPPARVFLGDAGSIPLGFLAGALGGWGAMQGAWPAWFPVLVFSPFIVDATLTVLRRAARGEVLWQAHRSHYYQRLVLAGWSHRRLARAAALLMLAVAASALAGLESDAREQWGIIFFWTVAHGLLFAMLERRLPSWDRAAGR